MNSLSISHTEATPIIRKRRLFKFSLKTLLVVMIVVAIWLGFYVKSFRDRRTAVAEIERLDGVMGIKYLGPDWLRKVVGDEKYFWDPAGVHFNRPLTAGEPEKVMPHLVRFQRLQDLTLPSPTITNDTLPLLLPLAGKLTYLSLPGPQRSDVAIVQFKRFPNLTTLQITGTQPSPAEVGELQNALPNCKITLQ